MLTLFLVRHAKSSWGDFGLSDFDRPLAPRGERAAPAMAAFMKAEGLVPDFVLCSTALRARQTWERMEPELGSGPEAEHVEILYGASPARMMEAVLRYGEGRSPVMIVAHNPGMEELALALSGSGPEPEMSRLRAKYPTAGLAVIDIDAPSWDQVVPGAGVLRRFVCPRDLA